MSDENTSVFDDEDEDELQNEEAVEAGEETAEEGKNKKSISADLIRGHINTIILRALFDGDRYGYDIINEIEQKSHGQYTLKQPTLYSALKRLESQGYVKSYWGGVSNGGRRRYFSLTESGKDVVKQNLAEWEYSRTIIDNLISDEEFDFSRPAPQRLDFRILRQGTSRTPIITELDAPPEFAASTSPSSAETEEEKAPEKEPEEELPQERQTESPFATFGELTSALTVTVTDNPNPLAPPFAEQKAEESQEKAETPKEEGVESSVEEVIEEAAEEPEPIKEEKREETSVDARETEPVPAFNPQSFPLDTDNVQRRFPLFSARSEEERNYKDIIGNIYKNSIKRAFIPVPQPEPEPQPQPQPQPAPPPPPPQPEPQPEPLPQQAPPPPAPQPKTTERYSPINRETEREIATPMNEITDDDTQDATGNFDFKDLKRQAEMDGLRVWIAGNNTKKNMIPEDFFNKGLSLMKSSLLFFAVAILESLFVILFKDYLFTSKPQMIVYITVMLAATVAVPAVCTILYLVKYAPCCRRLKKATPIETGVVVFLVLFILLVAIDLLIGIKMTNIPLTFLALIIPGVYLLNIILFSVVYYSFARSKI